jgi:Ca2+-binding EF-hand superfamily protein
MVDAKDLVIPYAYKKLMSPEEQHQVLSSFKNFDKSGDGVIEESEFKSLLKVMGRTDVTDE